MLLGFFVLFCDEGREVYCLGNYDLRILLMCLEYWCKGCCIVLRERLGFFLGEVELEDLVDRKGFFVELDSFLMGVYCNFRFC